MAALYAILRSQLCFARNLLASRIYKSRWQARDVLSA